MFFPRRLCDIIYVMSKPRKSFSKDIVVNIYISFGISFTLLFLGSSAFLYLSREEIEYFYTKVISLFGAFLLMYIILTTFLVNKIKRLFNPLDTLCYGIQSEKLSVYGNSKDMKEFVNAIRSNMDKMDYLEQELLETKNDIDDIQEESDKAINDLDNKLSSVKKLSDKLIEKQNKLLKSSDQIDSNINDIIDIDSRFKQYKNNLDENNENVKAIFKLSDKTSEDAKFDINTTRQAYKVLVDNLNESIRQLEMLLSDISILQTLSTKNNLYSVNTTVEASRAGTYNINIVNALDEIKNTSDKILEKTDQLSLELIQAKNSINLALMQASFCDEELESQGKTLAMLGDRARDISGELEGTIYSIDEIYDNIRELSQKAYEIQKINESHNNTIKEGLKICTLISQEL